MALTVAANSCLSHPALRVLADVDVANSFPLTLPADLGAAPATYATEDCYPGGALGTALYEGRLLGVPQIELTHRDGSAASAAVNAITLAVSNADGTLTPWAAQEMRGKRVRVHLWDAETGTLQVDLFVGVVAALAWSLHAVTLTVVAEDLPRLGEPFPRQRVTTAECPYAPTDPGPSGGLGDLVPFGTGIGRGVPCRQVSTRDDEGTLVTLGFTAAANNICTSTAHGLLTGDGPFLASSTGTLPGGVTASTPYWVIWLSADTFSLATTPANAQAGTAVDVTDTGSGTHTLRMGRAPQYLDQYDYAVGLGNLRIDRVQVGTYAPSLRAAGEFTILRRTYQWNGRYATAVRFPFPQGPPGARLAVLADVQRVEPDVDDAVLAEWPWQDSLEEELGGLTTTPVGGLTTADLVPGRTGVGLGAVALDGSTRYLSLTRAPYQFSVEPFTIEAWFRPVVGAPPTGPLFIGPDIGDGSAGYFFSLNPVSGRMEFGVRTAAGLYTCTSAVNAVMAGRWHYAACTRDAAGVQRLYLDGASVSVGPARPGPITYGGANAAMLGPGFAGALGWVRVSTVARDATYIAHAYGIGRRNPATFAREVCRAIDQPIDEASVATALTALDAVEDGALRCDGWVTEETTAQAVLDALGVFRGLRVVTGTDGLLLAEVLAPATTVAAQFGTGDTPWANVVSVDEYRASSLAEAVRLLPLPYRPQRDAAGRVSGYQHEIVADVLPVGSIAQPLPLPFVHDHVTADVIRSYLSALFVLRDPLLRVTVGHEARALQPGQIVRLHIPALGLSGADFAVTSCLHLIRAAQLTLVPYGEAPFTYLPQPVPVDAPASPVWRLGAGMTWSLTVPVISGRTVAPTLTLAEVVTVRPGGNAATQQADALVGAATHWQALAEASADGDTSYVAVTQGTAWVREQVLPSTFEAKSGRLVNLRVNVRARKTTSDAASIAPAMRVHGSDKLRFAGSPVSLTTSFADYAADWATWGGLATPWTDETVRTLEFGVQAQRTDNLGAIRITQTWLDLFYAVDAPDVVGFVRVYRAGPSASQPATPVETATAETWPSLSLPQLRLPDGSAGEKFWFWARVYDPLGRMIALVGPASVTVS
jgi:hypothetical protein